MKTATNRKTTQKKPAPAKTAERIESNRRGAKTNYLRALNRTLPLGASKTEIDAWWKARGY